MTMGNSKKRLDERKRRASRVREKINGTAERPRLCVRRTLSNMYAQLIDDINGVSIVQAGSIGKGFADKVNGKNLSKSEIAKLVGESLAEQAKEKGVTNVVFDRKGYLFHGRVKALAEAARAKGLIF
jgi:large subunit ribosomal protein L18